MSVTFDCGDHFIVSSDDGDHRVRLSRRDGLRFIRRRFEDEPDGLQSGLGDYQRERVRKFTVTKRAP